MEKSTKNISNIKNFTPKKELVSVSTQAVESFRNSETNPKMSSKSSHDFCMSTDINNFHIDQMADNLVELENCVKSYEEHIMNSEAEKNQRSEQSKDHTNDEETQKLLREYCTELEDKVKK